MGVFSMLKAAVLAQAAVQGLALYSADEKPHHGHKKHHHHSKHKMQNATVATNATAQPVAALSHVSATVSATSEAEILGKVKALEQQMAAREQSQQQQQSQSSGQQEAAAASNQEAASEGEAAAESQQQQGQAQESAENSCNGEPCPPEEPAPPPAQDNCPAPCQSNIDIDTDMPYGELEAFGREDTAQELTESAITESDEMVDQLERAEVAEEKRAVFRALTRLRGAAITSFDGVARAQTGNIDEYNKVHKWRTTHPLRHLADEESDIAKWAFPDNADF